MEQICQLLNNLTLSLWPDDDELPENAISDVKENLNFYKEKYSERMKNLQISSEMDLDILFNKINNMNYQESLNFK